MPDGKVFKELERRLYGAKTYDVTDASLLDGVRLGAKRDLGQLFGSTGKGLTDYDGETPPGFESLRPPRGRGRGRGRVRGRGGGGGRGRERGGRSAAEAVD